MVNLKTNSTSSKRLRIKFSGFKNSLHILPEDQAEHILKKVYKGKFDYVQRSTNIYDDCTLKVELNIIRVTPP